MLVKSAITAPQYFIVFILLYHLHFLKPDIFYLVAIENDSVTQGCLQEYSSVFSLCTLGPHFFINIFLSGIKYEASIFNHCLIKAHTQIIAPSFHLNNSDAWGNTSSYRLVLLFEVVTIGYSLICHGTTSIGLFFSAYGCSMNYWHASTFSISES